MDSLSISQVSVATLLLKILLAETSIYFLGRDLWLVGIVPLQLQTSGQAQVCSVRMSHVVFTANGRHAKGVSRNTWYFIMSWPRTGMLSLPLTSHWPKSHMAKAKINELGKCTPSLEGNHGRRREK